MSYQLYYSAGACSKAVHVLLNELNQPAEFINANKPGSKERTAEFLAINPRGQVPLLIVDGTPITEGGAIMTYLCDTHPSDLMPKSGIERAKALEALMFCNASMHPAYSPAFAVMKAPVDAPIKAAITEMSAKKVQSLYDVVEAKLAKQKYLAGDKFSPADILLAVFAGWNGVYGKDTIKLGPNTQRLVDEVSARPSFQKASETENADQKAAA